MNNYGTPDTISANPSSLTLSAFTAAATDACAGAAGNPCEVVLAREATALAARPGKTTVTHCITWSLGERRAAVRCQTATGHPIQCCGHGLLCSASLWLARWRAAGVLAACDADVPCRREDDIVWIGLPAERCEPVQVPDWLPGALGTDDILACANAGPDDGYLVMEMPRDYDLGAISPPGASLATNTARALIVTCAVSSSRALYDEQVHLRYFAPQYGVPEDAATGSAMRVLARYWHGLAGELVALQRSPALGYLRARLDGDRAWVGGHVSSLTTGNINNTSRDLIGDTAGHG